MKKITILAAILGIILLSNCRTSRSGASSSAAKLTYETNLKILIQEKCTPCHIPSKGGNKKAYDNFANVKMDIDSMIHRIELNPGQKGYMPFKKPKLSDSAIAVFKQWKEDGMLEN